ncbi:unnamed protein product [Arabidopsis thaliana]|uniref:RING-type domain-containing protein n=1 Tax=Arabidopsis thaliana TaxID=3702 RepID=A0A654FDN3_ARATH|nr:unnamed protein product [Arabidopsis thaliana]
MEEEGTLIQGDGSYGLYIREQLTSSIPVVLVTENQNKSFYELAMEAGVPEISIHMPAICRICFYEDVKAEQMYSVALCGHQFCVECVKQHIESRLLEGCVPRCPHYQCESKLTFRSCANLLTPKTKSDSSIYLLLKTLKLGDVVSNAVNPFASTAKFHGIVTCHAVITRGVAIRFATYVVPNGSKEVALTAERQSVLLS